MMIKEKNQIPLIKKNTNDTNDTNDTKNRYFYTELKKGLKKNRYFYSVLEKDLKTKNYNRWMYSYFKK